MKTNVKRSAGKVCKGDIIDVAVNLCVEVVESQLNGDNEVELTVQLEPERQKAFVDGQRRLVPDSVVTGKLTFSSSKRLGHLGNVEVLRAECQGALQLLKKLQGPSVDRATSSQTPVSPTREAAGVLPHGAEPRGTSLEEPITQN